jgi:hypothetical protein
MRPRQYAFGGYRPGLGTGTLSGRTPRSSPRISPRRQERISADTALRLARFFGTSERFWINLQSRYDLEIEKDRLGDALDGIRPLTAAASEPGRGAAVADPTAQGR